MKKRKPKVIWIHQYPDGSLSRVWQSTRKILMETGHNPVKFIEADWKGEI